MGPPKRRDHSFLGQVNDAAEKETLPEAGGTGRWEKQVLKVQEVESYLRNYQKTMFWELEKSMVWFNLKR